MDSCRKVTKLNNNNQVVDHAVDLSVSTKYLKWSNLLIVEKYEKGVINEKGITNLICAEIIIVWISI